MPHSHHSHSGQFCADHARNTLEEMVQMAIAKNLQVFACTEHMPRHEQDFYPGELESGHSLEKHYQNQANFFAEASRLQQKYKAHIDILIGFESEWIRPESRGLIERSLQSQEWDLFVGSVHHVHGCPIDFDEDSYKRARQKAGGLDEQLFLDYFDAQFEMLQTTKPPVVGHFDLIRLLSDQPGASFAEMESVWHKAQRNLAAVVSYGGLLELNVSALRKGLPDPYPELAICKNQYFVKIGGRFCLSDDSHGVEQIALNYDKVFLFMKSAGISELHYLRHRRPTDYVSFDARFAAVVLDRLPPDSIKPS